jgi:hypothetical protein
MDWTYIGKLLAFGLSCLGAGVFLTVAIGLIVFFIRDDRAKRYRDRQLAAQREADEHMFDLIFKGQGGAI